MMLASSQSQSRAPAPRSVCPAGKARWRERRPASARRRPARRRAAQHALLTARPPDRSPGSSGTRRDRAFRPARLRHVSRRSGAPRGRRRTRIPTCPVRDGRDSSRVMLTPCRASGVSSSCIAPGTLRRGHDQRSLVAPGAAALPACEITSEARGVVGFVLDAGGEHLQAVQLRRRASGDGRRIGLLRRQARGLGVARHRHAFEPRTILVQPAVALRQALRVRVDRA